MFTTPAFAQGFADPQAMMQFLPLVLIFVVFYFLLIRPQQKRAKDHKAMLSALRRGDRVVTGGGIIGTVAKVVGDDEVAVDTAPAVDVYSYPHTEYRGQVVYYVNGRWYEPAPVFYQQTAQLIDQNPPLTADAAAKLDWIPLGVFAATPDGLNEPDVTVQLAATKDGLIGGTAFDPKTGAAYNIRGAVDKKTQRAVWSYTNDRNQRVMMETSVYNLTQPEATGLVHYSPNDMRVVELVRLQQPDAGATTGTPSLPAPTSGQ